MLYNQHLQVKTRLFMISEKSLGQMAFFGGGERVNNSEPLGGLGENRGLYGGLDPPSDNYQCLN